MLAEAGYPHGIKITLTSVSIDDSAAEQLQGQLAGAGIAATISNVPSDTETQYLYLDKTIPLAIDGTAGRAPGGGRRPSCWPGCERPLGSSRPVWWRSPRAYLSCTAP